MALVIGVTGGIGAGKSTVAALLGERGAVLISADDFARRALAPGTNAHDQVITRFGAGVTGDDGTLDRRALAQVIFNDDSARAEVEAIVHPLVHRAIDLRLRELGDSDQIVVLESPLLVENAAQHERVDGLLVVDAPEDLAVDRLIRLRKMDKADAMARVGAQTSRTARIQAADFVIMNMGSLDELVQMVDEAWQWIERLRIEHHKAPPI